MSSRETGKDRALGASTDDSSADSVQQLSNLLVFRVRPLREIEAYWQAIRGSDLVPRRSDIDPRGIESDLEFAFIAERIAHSQVRIRVGGSHLCDLIGMEVRGMPLSAMMVPRSRHRLAASLNQAFDGPARIEFSLLGEPSERAPKFRGQMLLLPLADDFGQITRLLGCLVTDGPHIQAPQRFEIETCTVAQLDGPVRARQPAPQISKKTGFAEATPRIQPTKTPYLRLVD